METALPTKMEFHALKESRLFMEREEKLKILFKIIKAFKIKGFKP